MIKIMVIMIELFIDGIQSMACNHYMLWPFSQAKVSKIDCVDVDRKKC